MDVAEAIDDEAVNVLHTRRTDGTYTAGGKFVPGAASIDGVTIRAAVQPAQGRSLMDMEESIRVEARYFAWSRVQLEIGDVIGYPAIAGKNYKIIFVWPRPADGFSKVAMGLLKP